MLELAEDEQLEFTKQMLIKAFRGKRPVKNPTFCALVGAAGSGKSTLASKLENTIVISSDNVLLEYAKTLGIDTREDFYDKDIGKFATKVSSAIYQAAVHHQMNVAYDTTSIKNIAYMLENVPQNYDIDVKVMLTDEFQAAMNVIERKMDYDKAYTRHKCSREKYGYPQGNPLDVQMYTSLDGSVAVMDFLDKALQKGYPIEIYEFGKDEPSFRSGENFQKFLESLELIPMSEHIKRCDKLKERAKQEGKENAALSLMALKQIMQERR